VDILMKMNIYADAETAARWIIKHDAWISP
jgi:hypothetical protein